MNGASGATVRRVVSADGTEIACVTSGAGPPLILVHGMVSDHHRWSPLLPHLEPNVTVHAMDRRGRGLSGDAPDYGVVSGRVSVPAWVKLTRSILTIRTGVFQPAVPK
jgi:pimeloyl-ACP methyl ester carboxylesterase